MCKHEVEGKVQQGEAKALRRWRGCDCHPCHQRPPPAADDGKRRLGVSEAAERNMQCYGSLLSLEQNGFNVMMQDVLCT
jgi:hypothetical protein